MTTRGRALRWAAARADRAAPIAAWTEAETRAWYAAYDAACSQVYRAGEALLDLAEAREDRRRETSAARALGGRAGRPAAGAAARD